MKRFVIFLVLVVLPFVLCGCDYYNDAMLDETLPQPDSTGLVAYQGGVSEKKNTAKIDLLRYELDTVVDGQIKIVLPETLKDNAGKEIPIEVFGGPIGTNAPLRKFDLIIHIQEGTMPEEPVALTIDAGSLPLDTGDWNAVQVCFLTDGTVTEIPLESVTFLSDEPLVYKLYLKEESPNGSVSDATDSDKWYEVPNTKYIGGEKVVIRVKHPEDGVKRSLDITHEPVEIIEDRDEYVEYAFIMPYHDVRITIVDEKG